MKKWIRSSRTSKYSGVEASLDPGHLAGFGQAGILNLETGGQQIGYHHISTELRSMEVRLRSMTNSSPWRIAFKVDRLSGTIEDAATHLQELVGFLIPGGSRQTIELPEVEDRALSPSFNIDGAACKSFRQAQVITRNYRPLPFTDGGGGNTAGKRRMYLPNAIKAKAASCVLSHGSLLTC